MSAIVHKFKIPLTAEQAEAIRRQWKNHASYDRAMLAIQPIGMAFPDGVVDAREPHLNCAILDSEMATAVNNVIVAHKEARP